MIILLLSGWAGAGKDATAYLLSSYGFKRFAFADPLKKQVAAEFRFPVELCHTQQGKQVVLQSAGGKTVREMLVKRGQEIRAEKQNSGYFAEQISNSILQYKYEKVVISDWRLPDEYSTINATFSGTAKIVTVRVNRTSQQTSLHTDALTEHSLDSFPFDVVIENSGQSWKELEKEIKKKLSLHLDTK